MKKEKRSRCTWVVGKKKKKGGGGGGISYGNIEGERNRMRKEGILEVVKKINNKNKIIKIY
jgi:hypothetical protein